MKICSGQCDKEELTITDSHIEVSVLQPDGNEAIKDLAWNDGLPRPRLFNIPVIADVSVVTPRSQDLSITDVQGRSSQGGGADQSECNIERPTSTKHGYANS